MYKSRVPNLMIIWISYKNSLKNVIETIFSVAVTFRNVCSQGIHNGYSVVETKVLNVDQKYF